MTALGYFGTSRQLFEMKTLVHILHDSHSHTDLNIQYLRAYRTLAVFPAVEKKQTEKNEGAG